MHTVPKVSVSNSVLSRHKNNMLLVSIL